MIEKKQSLRSRSWVQLGPYWNGPWKEPQQTHSSAVHKHLTFTANKTVTMGPTNFQPQTRLTAEPVTDLKSKHIQRLHFCHYQFSTAHAR